MSPLEAWLSNRKQPRATQGPRAPSKGNRKPPDRAKAWRKLVIEAGLKCQ